jgi:hypothetical protein
MSFPVILFVTLYEVYMCVEKIIRISGLFFWSSAKILILCSNCTKNSFIVKFTFLFLYFINFLLHFLLLHIKQLNWFSHHFFPYPLQWRETFVKVSRGECVSLHCLTCSHHILRDVYFCLNGSHFHFSLFSSHYIV